jgi:hypothetical protein
VGFLGLGIPEFVIVVPVLVPLLLFPALFWRRAKRFGYPSMRAYLRAAPRSDPEKRDAADLALKGLVVCMLGLIFPPFILFGLFPLFYGARKLAYASMGLGLVDDADQTGA